ncbi:L-rhamnose mutarotase [Pedobacter sp. L105]|uniref:L-rhamnose mutarotase n=1 Tax=Pedobacter sp. L105 TaxID=1641871 RepID=UPI00131DB898|nr:L-rhamnose mutarotase [Pedobacter sp. L105]
MERIAFKMKLYPGRESEYRKRHDELWPELSALLKKTGVSDYSIFFDEETHMLFGVLKVSNRALFDRLAEEPVMLKWWSYMHDLMETNMDKSPVSKALKEVFYLG